MAFPFVAIAAAFSVLQGVVGFVQQRAAARNQERVANYQATLAGREADVIEQRAGQERAAAQRTEIEQRRRGRIVRSNALAAMGASGAGFDTDILADIDTEAELRALTARYEGEESAQSLEYDALLTRAGAEGTRAAGRAARSAGEQQAFLTLAGGAGQAASLYAKYGEGGFDAAFNGEGSLGTARRSQWYR